MLHGVLLAMLVASASAVALHEATREVTHEELLAAARTAGIKCEDALPEDTHYKVYTDEGFKAYATCRQLSDNNYCVNWENASLVQQVCPVSCHICDPNKIDWNESPCYDEAVTGMKFVNGPEAKCSDLARYCRHHPEVQTKCRKTCGLCEIHENDFREGGACRDMRTHDAPEFVVAGALARCSELVDFCNSGQNQYLIRHKCPMTCGACRTPEAHARLKWHFANDANWTDVVYSSTEQDPRNCPSRRRYGFCATRRRRNW